LIDINVWLALTWDQHPQHAAAVRWFAPMDDAAFLFCRFTMLGFLRLLTNQQVMGDSVLTVAGALELYDRWRGDPRVELAAEPRGTEDRFRSALRRHATVSATKAIADSYLAGFAEAADAQLVTFDKALAAAAEERHTPAVLLTPAPGRASAKRRGR
jgi:toxin-antitoxin system PIN domain toxin